MEEWLDATLSAVELSVRQFDREVVFAPIKPVEAKVLLAQPGHHGGVLVGREVPGADVADRVAGGTLLLRQSGVSKTQHLCNNRVLPVEMGNCGNYVG
jgi:hypothetical protein